MIATAEVCKEFFYTDIVNIGLCFGIIVFAIFALAALLTNMFK